MTFYLSCRPLRFRREIVSPKECLKYNFPEINFRSRCIAFNMKIDGRWLYEICLCQDYTDAEADEFKEEIKEGLAAFGAHLQSTASAQALAERITGQDFVINGDCIESPEEEPA